MGSPITTGSWDAVANAAYYAGAGYEAIWLWVSILLCVGACWFGHMHENKVNKER